MLPEDMHVSYIVDRLVYENLYTITCNLVFNSDNEKKYIMKHVYTGWAYYPDKKTFLKQRSKFEHSPGVFCVYLISNPFISGRMAIQDIDQKTGKRPDSINIFINPIKIRDLRFAINKEFVDSNIIKDDKLIEREFSRELMGDFDHEFVHARHIFMTKDGSNSLEKQGKQKDTFKDYIYNLSIDDEQKEIVYRLFYYFMPTEIQARISSTARLFEDKHLRDKARNTLKDVIT